MRLSQKDYIASLVRSEIYCKDYSAYIAAYEIEKGERQRGIFHRVDGDATWDFLRRWPLLWEPIDPVDARKSPLKYLNHLVPAVFPEKDIPLEWLKVAHNLPWPEGRFLPVWINFFRSESEIITEIINLSKQLKFGGFKKSVPKAKEMPDPWKVWDTFKGAGKEDIRKTAEILFSNSFRYRGDKKEMEDEAKKEYEAKKKTISRLKAESWYDNRLAKATAATWRQDERKKLISYVREVLKSCRQKIEMHSPVTGDPPLFRLV